VSLDHWAAEVRQASSILASHGHPISEADKSLAFRHGFNRADLQMALIFPARRENFVQATAETSGLSLQAVDDGAILLLWMWNAFAVICVGTMLMLVSLPNSVVHVQRGRRTRHSPANC
jgi:hypothetical protein